MVVSRSTAGVGAPEMAGFDVSAASIKIGNKGRVVFSATPASLAKVVDGKTYSSRDVDAGSLIADFAEDGNGSGKKADDWRHVVFSFTNKQGVNRSFVLNLATDPVFKDGLIKYKGKVDLDKTETRMLEGMPGGKKYLVEGDYEIPKARLIFSSFEDDDLKRARKYNRRFGDPSKTASLSLKLLDSGGNQIASKDQSGRLGPLFLCSKTLRSIRKSVVDWLLPGLPLVFHQTFL